MKVSTLRLKLFKSQLVFMNLNRKVKTSPRYGGAKSTIGGYEAYVVNCIAKNGKYLIIWVFKSDDGKFRYVSLEGVPEVLKNLLPMVEESWTNKKS